MTRLTLTFDRRSLLKLGGVAGVAACLPTVFAGAAAAHEGEHADCTCGGGGAAPAGTVFATVPWDAPSSWPSGRVPGPRDVAVVDRPVLLTGVREVAGVRVTGNGALVFSASHDTTLLSRGNVLVHGVLQMRPSSGQVQHRLTFIGVDEQKFVGGGMKVLASDVGLWVECCGVLDAVGTARAGWNRTGVDRTWAPSDEIYQAPYAFNDFTTFPRHPFGATAPGFSSSVGEVRTEVFNVTRNVVIGGTVTGRAHVMFLQAGAQTIRYVRFEHLGPRKTAADGYSELVTGRYGLHFHHCGDAARGSLVEGVVVAHCGTRAFVPHASNGMTFRDCVAYDIAGEAFWWDPDTKDTYPTNAGHDVTYDRCGAFRLGTQPKTRNNTLLTGFMLGQGTGNKCIDGVAAGVANNGVRASGFMWPETTGALPGEWVFRGCTAHNNRLMGIFFWQNDPHYRRNHLMQEITCYRNGGVAVLGGAYLSKVRTVGGRVFENASRMRASGQWKQDVGWNHGIEAVRMDAGGRSDYALLVPSHRTSKPQPVLVRSCDLRGGRIAPVGVAQGTVAGHFDFVRVTVNGTRDLEPGDFHLVTVAKGTRLRVQRRNGTAYVIDETKRARSIPAFA